jgi:hypothetical protein
VYGADNAVVRQNIRAVEAHMPRYQTGQAPDPSHVVPYHNHPYDKTTRRRVQQQQEGKNATSRFSPIRMHFETVALDQMSTQNPANAAKIACTYRTVPASSSRRQVSMNVTMASLTHTHVLFVVCLSFVYRVCQRDFTAHARLLASRLGGRARIRTAAHFGL